jgi:lipopolysaccharide transport system permease protein
MKTDDELVIEAGRAERQYWSDLWLYRELFQILAWRDLAVRYKQTVIGIAWALIRPVLMMLIFTVVFGRIAKLPSDGTVPYALMVFAGMLPWQFFSAALTESSNSLIQNANLIAKIYFPRLIIPASAVITSLVDLIISFVLMLGMMAFYSYWPDWHILFLPLFIALAFAVAIGLGLWLSALNVEYRDFRHIVPFIVCVIDGFRWSVLRGEVQFYWPGLLFSIGLTLLLCYSGVAYFRKMERTFADVI